MGKSKKATSGDLTIDLATALGGKSLRVFGLSGGLPSVWNLEMATSPTAPGYDLYNLNDPSIPDDKDQLRYYGGANRFDSIAYITNDPGLWTSAPDVPLPPTALLPGSGLLGRSLRLAEKEGLRSS